MVDTLSSHGVKIVVCPSRQDVLTPDAVFPNNWFSLHEEGVCVLYPMLAPNRRLERQIGMVQEQLGSYLDFTEIRILDLTYLENSGHFLEGTGSLVLDRKNKVAFAVESPRTSLVALNEFCTQMDYAPVVFHASDKGRPIYHTNVVMGIGEEFAVVCFEAIQDSQERIRVEQTLRSLNLQLVPITLEQLRAYCGNVLEVQSVNQEPKLLMSQTSFAAFSQDQKQQLEQFAQLVPVRIPTIETVGGGSARCMVAEVFPSTHDK